MIIRLQKTDEKQEVSELAVLAQKWVKIAPQIFFKFVIFANNPAVNSGEVSRVRVRGCGCWRY